MKMFQFKALSPYGPYDYPDWVFNIDANYKRATGILRARNRYMAEIRDWFRQ